MIIVSGTVVECGMPKDIPYKELLLISDIPHISLLL